MILTELERVNAGKVRGLQTECTVLLKKNGDFPLDGPCRIALYGNGARNTLRGGTGSGEVYSHFTVSIEKALEKAGFTITTKSWLDEYDKVAKKSREAFVDGIKQRAKEKHVSPIFEGMGAVMPEPEYDIPLEGDGDAAVYVLSRICGEGNDRVAEKGDILLTEISTILALYRKFDKFMLVLNVGGPVDLTPVLDVENILLLSQLGALTGYAFSDILLGKHTPSGKLATTWTSWDAYPELFDFGDLEDTGYKEGIYVGYRYFNTVGTKVLFPFGFGLSYTDFKVKETGTELNGENVKVSFIVENTGDFVGKEVVQLYVSKPSGKLDQPKDVLAGWVKTEKIAPKQISKADASFDLSDLASFDTESASYILEKGDYVVKYGTDSVSLTPCAVIRLPEDVVVRKVRNLSGAPDFDDFKPTGSDVKDTGVSPQAEKTSAELKVLVADVNSIKKDDVQYDIEPEISDEVKDLTDEELVYLNIGAFFENGVGGSMIGNAGRLVAGAAGETTDKLRNRGIPSLSMADGPAGVRISQKYWVDEEGAHSVGNTMLEGLADFLPKPAVIMGKLFNQSKPKHGEKIETHYATAIPIGTALAQSWNLKLVERCGDIVGSEMEEFGVQLWLAPAMNIHRNIRCGRNFEYYSEDPLVTGLCAAADTKGVQSIDGKGVTIKHFACNNQEDNRMFSNSHVSVRALRDIYLRGFEIAVKLAQPFCVMASYNLLNGIHTANNYELIQSVLRDEWDYEGAVMTDWFSSFEDVEFLGYDEKKLKYPPAFSRLCVYAGCDMQMPGCAKNAEDIVTAVNHGRLTLADVQSAAMNVVRLAIKCL